MKRTNFLPILSLLTAFVVVVGALNVSLGQNPGDEIIIELDDDLTPAMPDEPAEQATPTPAPAVVAPASAFNPVVINQRIVRLEAQAKTMIENQKKIDDALVAIAEDVRQARIYASRTGGGASSGGGE